MAYEKIIKLPSKGLVYEEPVEEVVIRNLTVADERTLFSSLSEDNLNKVIKGCIVSPTDLDIENLIASDRHFILMELRKHTYGPEYHVHFQCETCGREEEMKISLADMECETLEDDFMSKLVFELPISKDTVELKVLTGKDDKQIANYAKSVAKKTGAKAEEVEYVERIVRRIVSINGEEKDLVSKRQYVRDMHSRDSAYIDYRLNQVKVGYTNTVPVTCPSCGELEEVPVRLTGEFFRPRFD